MTLAAYISALPILLRRAVALVLLAAGAALAFSAVVLPLDWVAASQEQWRNTVREQLARDRGRAGQEAEVRGSLAKLPSSPIWKQFYPAQSAVEASRLIEQDLARLSLATGISFESAAPLPTNERKPLSAIGVRLTASITAEQLRALLAALRTHQPYLRAERLTVAAPQTQTQTVDENAILIVGLDIFGYLREEASTL